MLVVRTVGVSFCLFRDRCLTCGDNCSMYALVGDKTTLTRAVSDELQEVRVISLSCCNCHDYRIDRRSNYQ